MTWRVAIHLEQPSRSVSKLILKISLGLRLQVPSNNAFRAKTQHFHKSIFRGHVMPYSIERKPHLNLSHSLKSYSGRLLGPRCFTLSRRVKFYPTTMVQGKAKDSSHTQENKHSPIILVFMGHHARCLW